MLQNNHPPQLVALLTPREAAKYLPISERNLWNLKKSREIAHVRSGRCVRYSVKDLERWPANLIEDWIKASCPSCDEGSL